MVADFFDYFRLNCECNLWFWLQTRCYQWKCQNCAESTAKSATSAFRRFKRPARSEISDVLLSLTSTPYPEERIFSANSLHIGCLSSNFAEWFAFLRLWEYHKADISLSADSHGSKSLLNRCWAEHLYDIDRKTGCASHNCCFQLSAAYIWYP